MMQTPHEQRSDLGERARQLVIERFSLEAVLDSWEALYLDLLQRNPRPARWGREH
jgi:glycosyltransferase involved in cell wall biosynthesis